jgi:hypothetical protein
MSWYGILMFQSSKQEAEYRGDSKHYKSIQGESQPLYFFMSKMKTKEVKAFAIRQLWEKQRLELPYFEDLFGGGIEAMLTNTKIESYVSTEESRNENVSEQFIYD